MADSKLIVFAVVALVVGIGIGAGVGYAAFNKPADTNDDPATANETYWFYVDYNVKESDTLKSKWISVSSESPLKALTASLDKAGITYEIDSKTGWITSIGGVGGDTNHAWASWLWIRTNYADSNTSVEYPAWLANPGFNVTIGNVFYLGYTPYDSVTYVYDLNPNAITKWKTGGPFAAA